MNAMVGSSILILKKQNLPSPSSLNGGLGTLGDTRSQCWHPPRCSSGLTLRLSWAPWSEHLSELGHSQSLAQSCLQSTLTYFTSWSSMDSLVKMLEGPQTINTKTLPSTLTCHTHYTPINQRKGGRAHTTLVSWGRSITRVLIEREF